MAAIAEQAAAGHPASPALTEEQIDVKLAGIGLSRGAVADAGLVPQQVIEAVEGADSLAALEHVRLSMQARRRGSPLMNDQFGGGIEESPYPTRPARPAAPVPAGPDPELEAAVREEIGKAERFADIQAIQQKYRRARS